MRIYSKCMAATTRDDGEGKRNENYYIILRNGFMFDNRTTKKRIIPTSSSLPSCLGSLTRTLFIFFSSVESMSEHRKCSNLARLQQRRSLCVQYVSQPHSHQDASSVSSHSSLLFTHSASLWFTTPEAVLLFRL